MSYAIKQWFAKHYPQTTVYIFEENFNRKLLAKINEKPDMKYVFAFQLDQKTRTYCRIELARDALARDSKCVCIVDRGHLGNMAIARANVNSRRMTNQDYENIYLDAFFGPGSLRENEKVTAFRKEKYFIHKKIFRYLYMNVTPQQALFRTKNIRQRPEETNNQLDYYREIDKQHKKLLDIAQYDNKVIVNNDIPLDLDNTEMSEALIQRLVDAFKDF